MGKTHRAAPTSRLPLKRSAIGSGGSAMSSHERLRSTSVSAFFDTRLLRGPRVAISLESAVRCRLNYNAPDDTETGITSASQRPWRNSRAVTPCQKLFREEHGGFALPLRRQTPRDTFLRDRENMKEGMFISTLFNTSQRADHVVCSGIEEGAGATKMPLWMTEANIQTTSCLVARFK